MVAEYRPHVQALPRLTDDSWRLAGCGERCRIFWVSAAGRAYPEQMVSHDPHHHEAYGENVLARRYAMLHDRTVRTGDLELDGPRGETRVAGRATPLTPREAGILFYLGSKLDLLCYQEEILNAVWGPEYAGEVRIYGGKAVATDSHLLRVNMARLRAKLGTAARLVETVIGRGYRLRAESPVDLGV